MRQIMDTRTRAGLFLAALLLLADAGLILSFPSRGGSERFIFRTMGTVAGFTWYDTAAREALKLNEQAAEAFDRVVEL